MSFTRDRYQRRRRCVRVATSHAYMLCQLRHGRRFKKGSQRQFELKGTAKARDHLRRQQGVSAQCKEVVMNSNWRQAQHFTEDLSNTCLDRSSRLDEFFFPLLDIW